MKEIRRNLRYFSSVQFNRSNDRASLDVNNAYDHGG